MLEFSIGRNWIVWWLTWWLGWCQIEAMEEICQFLDSTTAQFDKGTSGTVLFGTRAVLGILAGFIAFQGARK